MVIITMMVVYFNINQMQLIYHHHELCSRRIHIFIRNTYLHHLVHITTHLIQEPWQCIPHHSFILTIILIITIHVHLLHLDHHVNLLHHIHNIKIITMDIIKIVFWQSRWIWYNSLWYVFSFMIVSFYVNYTNLGFYFYRVCVYYIYCHREIQYGIILYGK